MNFRSGVGNERNQGVEETSDVRHDGRRNEWRLDRQAASHILNIAERYAVKDFHFFLERLSHKNTLAVEDVLSK